jgi:hypothetical protein
MTRLRQNTLPKYRHAAIGSAVTATGCTLRRLTLKTETVTKSAGCTSLFERNVLEGSVHFGWSWSAIIRVSGNSQNQRQRNKEKLQ